MAIATAPYRHARKSETTLSGGFMFQITQFDANGA